MFFRSRPTDQEIREFIKNLADSAYSYNDVGASASLVPPSYTLDHNRVRLGAGTNVWEAAIKAINSWEMFNLGWVQLCWPETPIHAGCDVAVLVRHYGFYSLNGARIVYVMNDQGPATKRFGFAYGTLTDHAESGEERFMVEWNHEDDSVCYDVLAFSRPKQLLARLGYPLSRRLQKRFAKDSKSAMVAFTRSEHHSCRDVL
jgi:uncharacterized protein (UPF0548 family)